MIKVRNFRLLQDIYKNDPWKMLVCCIMLNLTTRKQVDKIRHKLFKKYPNPRDLANAAVSELSKMLTPLGMQNKRAVTLIRFSLEYLDGFSDLLNCTESVSMQKIRGKSFSIIILMCSLMIRS